MGTRLAYSNLGSLTGMRFIAALLVFGTHARELLDLDGGASMLLQPGMVGVSFFFILSGFLLAWSQKAGDRHRDFWQRRFARIYPAYFVAWVLIAGADVVTGDGFTWTDAISLTLTQAWFPSDAIYFAVSAVFWSLSCEAFFYLVFPFIFPLFARLKAGQRIMIGTAAVALILGIAVLVDPLVPGSVGHWVLYFFPPTRCLEFVIGILMALHMKAGWTPRLPLAAALAITAGAFVAAAFVPGSFMRVATTVVPFALLIAVAARADLAGLWSPFRSRAMVTLGEWSYSFYLLHATALGFCINTIERVTHIDRANMGPLMLLAICVLGLIASTAAAGLLFRLVERPMNNRLRTKRRVAEIVSEPAASN